MTVVAGDPGILHQMIGMMAGREASMTMMTPGVPEIAAVLVIPGVPEIAAVLVIPGVPGIAAVLVIPGVPGMTAVLVIVGQDQVAVTQVMGRKVPVAAPVQTVPHQIPALHPEQVENLLRKESSGG